MAKKEIAVEKYGAKLSAERKRLEALIHAGKSQQCRSHASAAGRGGVRGDAEQQVQSQLCPSVNLSCDVTPEQPLWSRPLTIPATARVTR